MLQIPNNDYENYLISLQADKKQNESDFQEAYDKRDVNKMWWCVYITCLNIAKNIYKKRGVIIPNERLLEVAIDGAAYCMKFVLGKNVRPEKLSSYCFLRVRRFIDDPKVVKQEKFETSFLYDKDGHQLDVGEYYDKYEWMENIDETLVL